MKNTMKNTMKNIIKKFCLLFLITILVFGMMIFGEPIGELIAAPMLRSSNPAIAFAGEYFAYIGRCIMVTVYCLLIKKNRIFLSLLGKGGRGNNVKTVLAIGIPCGFGINLLIGLLAAAHGDIKLTYADFNLPLLLLLLVSVAIQSGAEELINRWFLYQKVRELFPNIPMLPVLFTAVIFSFVHVFNPGMTFLSFLNIVLVGILYALIIYYFDSIWACVLAHTGWNFCQCIILGLPNSGTISRYSVFTLDIAGVRNSFTYNTEFGIEGTLMSSVVLLITITSIVIAGRRNIFKNNEAARR